MCTPDAAAILRTVSLSAGLCDIFSLTLCSSFLWACHFGFPFIFLLSFWLPFRINVLVRKKVYHLSLLSATNLHFLSGVFYILSLALTRWLTFWCTPLICLFSAWRSRCCNSNTHQSSWIINRELYTILREYFYNNHTLDSVYIGMLLFMSKKLRQHREWFWFFMWMCIFLYVVVG